MASKRKRRYTWFPGLGQPRVGVSETKFVNQNDFTLTPFDTNTEVNAVLPIAADEGEDEDANEGASSFLNDSLGQDYFVERIVGTMFVACQQLPPGEAGNAISSMTAVAGIFVGPKAPGAPTQALGANDPNTYSPMLSMNADQPWMFRRTWVVGNLAIPVSASLFGNFPPTNASGHGLTSPDVDVRSVRRIHKNERLFLSLSILQTYPDQTLNEGGNAPQVRFSWDFRILGALRRARNTSNYRP